MKKNRIIALISSAVMLFASASAFAATKAEIEAADVKVRYEINEPDAYTAGATFTVKMYVDNIPELNLAETGEGFDMYWNGSAISQWTSKVNIEKNTCQFTNMKTAFTAPAAGKAAQMSVATDRKTATMALTATSATEYWTDKSFEGIDDPYFVEFYLKLNEDLTEKIELDVETIINFQAIVNSQAEQVSKTVSAPIVIDPTGGDDEDTGVTMDQTAYSKDAAYNPNGEKTFAFKGTMNTAARYVNLVFEGANVDVVLDFGETKIDATKTFGLNIMQVPKDVSIKAPTATAIDALTGVEGEDYILVK